MNLPNSINRMYEDGPLVSGKTTLPDVTISPVSWVEQEFSRYLDHHRTEREREERNHAMFSGLDHGQYPKELLDAIRNGDMDRDISTYNFIQGKVMKLAGYFLKNMFDVDYAPVDGIYSDLTVILKKLYYTDKDLCDWNTHYLQGLVDGFIYGTHFRLTRDTRYSELGNIGLVTVGPGKFLPSPTWRSKTMKDCRSGIMIGYMTPRQIMNTYESKTDLIKQQIISMAQASQFAKRGDYSIQQYEIDAIYGNEYRVIEYHHMETEQVIRRTAMDFDGRLIDVPNPPEELKSNQAITQWLDLWYSTNGIDKDSIIERKSTHDIYYITTVCPDLSPSSPLEDRRSDIQIGRLPFYNFSYLTHNGRKIGLVDIISDPQVTFNKRMGLINEIIANTAKGGSKIFDPDVFGEDAEKIELFKKNGNRPDFIIESAPGYIANGNKVFAEKDTATYPNLELNNASMMMSLIDQLSPQNLALEGSNESSKETGILFERKREQGETNLTPLVDSLKIMWGEIGEGYMLYAQSLYSGLYREIRGVDGDFLELNKPQQGFDGVEYRINDISLLPPHKVMVSDSPLGSSQRLNDRISSIELLRVMPQDLKISQLGLFGRVVKTLDNYTQKDKEEIEGDLNLEREAMRKTLLLNMLNTEFQTMQLQMQIDQMKNPPKAPPQQGEGIPPEMAQEGEQPDQGMVPPVPPQGFDAGMSQGPSQQQQMPVRTPQQMGM